MPEGARERLPRARTTDKIAQAAAALLSGAVVAQRTA
jgi:hypothetical protein